MRILGIAAAALGLVTAMATTEPASAAPAAQAGCAGNLLANADFEGASRKTEGEGTSLSSAVSNGWSPWFVRGDATFNREPEFKVEQVRIGGDRARIRSGLQSMKWFTTWGTHTAGIYQRVAVRPGTALTFAIHGMAYTGEDDGWDPVANTFVSDPIKPGNYRMSVGIDPTGAVPAMGSAPPATTLWSEPSMTYDQWVRMTVSAVARAGFVTVYAKGQPEWSVKHNDSFWEDACLRVGTLAEVAASSAGAPGAVVAPPPSAAVAGAAASSGAAASAVSSAPAAAKPAAARPAASGTAGKACRLQHTVARGETVSAIAAANGSTVAAIAGASSLSNPGLIQVGQVLCIP